MSRTIMKLKFVVGIALSCAAFPALLLAQQPLPRPEAFQKLLDCKRVSDANARLACFDQQVAVLEAAERDSSVVVVDKKQLQRADKGLFGSYFANINGQTAIRMSRQNQ